MNKRLVVFLEFLISGIILGVFEDVLLIKILTEEPITFSIVIVVFLVTLPFAFIGEYIVDRIDFLKMFNLNKKYKKVEVFLEFLVFGIALGIVEDLLAVHLSTGHAITFYSLLMTLVVVIPFAFIGEYVIDRINIQKTIKEKKIVPKKAVMSLE